MARVLVLGAGLMGPAIAADLLRFNVAERVVVGDSDPRRVSGVVEGLNDPRCEGLVLDVWDRPKLVEAMRRVDVVAGAYPSAAIREVTGAAIEAGVHLADLTGTADGFNVLDYHQRALDAGVAVIEGTGVAPGLSNALVGQGATRFDEVEDGAIYVAGLPVHPLPPMNYRTVFSIDTVLDEYCAPVFIVKDGALAEAPALGGVETIDFPAPVGRLEAFYTYGLGTLAQTGPAMGFRNLSERTCRYPGHRDQVAFLRESGLLSQTPVAVDGVEVVPRRVAAAVLAPLWSRGDPADVTVMRVRVSGLKGGRRSAWEFDLIDWYDPVGRVTSMARTTGYTCSIVVGMILRGRVAARGAVVMEHIFRDPALFRELLAELSKRGINVTERMIEG